MITTKLFPLQSLVIGLIAVFLAISVSLTFTWNSLKT